LKGILISFWDCKKDFCMGLGVEERNKSRILQETKGHERRREV
jgi:hypothetical protein